MFYLSCPSAPLTINLRQCHYHHCHHQCYISVVIVFASAIINLNIYDILNLDKVWNFLTPPVLANLKRMIHWFQSKGNIGVQILLLTQTRSCHGALLLLVLLNPIRPTWFFLSLLNSSVWQSCLGAESPVYGEIWKDTSSHSHHQEGEDQHLFLRLFPFLWREGIRTVLKPSLSPMYPSKGPHIKAKIGQRPPEIVYIWHI